MQSGVTFRDLCIHIYNSTNWSPQRPKTESDVVLYDMKLVNKTIYYNICSGVGEIHIKIRSRMQDIYTRTITRCFYF